MERLYDGRSLVHRRQVPDLNLVFSCAFVLMSGKCVDKKVYGFHFHTRRNNGFFPKRLSPYAMGLSPNQTLSN